MLVNVEVVFVGEYVVSGFYKKVTNSCDTWSMRYTEREIPEGCQYNWRSFSLFPTAVYSKSITQEPVFYFFS
jgi:hypothetical protein